MSWAVLGLSWTILESSGTVLGPSWAVLGFGRLEAIFETSGAVLERREAEKVRTPKSIKNLRKIIVFCFLGLS